MILLDSQPNFNFYVKNKQQFHFKKIKKQQFHLKQFLHFHYHIGDEEVKVLDNYKAYRFKYKNIKLLCTVF